MQEIVLTTAEEPAKLAEQYQAGRIIAMPDVEHIRETIAPNFDRVIVHHEEFAEAEKLAKGLIAQGLPDTKVMFASDLTDAPKHIYWRENYPLTEIKPDTEKYAPCGIEGLGDSIRWRLTSGELCTIVGPYGCGKSTVAQMLGFDYLTNIAGPDEHIGICSWEDRDFVVERRLSNYGRWFFQGHDDIPGRIYDLKRRTRYVTVAPTKERTIPWLIDQIRFMVGMYGTKLVIVDPYNKFDHDFGGRSETEYVKDLVTGLQKVIAEFGVILIMVTHVAKDSYNPDGNVRAFRLANAHGSIHWGNGSDHGICVARTSAFGGDKTLIRIDKVKDEGLAYMGVKKTLAYDLIVDECRLALDMQLTMSDEVQGIWV